MRRLSTAVLAAAAIVAACMGLGAPQAGAASGMSSTSAFGNPGGVGPGPAVQVVKISGLLDPVLANFLETSVAEAERSGSIGMVLQVNSTGSVISNQQLKALATKLHNSTIPIVAWVGPSGAKAHGGTAQLVATLTKVGVAPGSTIGDTGDPVIPTSMWSPAFRKYQVELRDHTVGSGEAKSKGLAPKDMLVLRQALLQVPGFDPGTATSTAAVPEGATPLVFSAVPTGSGVMHTVASPPVAYLLFVIGLALIIFELFTAGVGIAGLVGAGAFVLGSYGLWVLPARPLSIALLCAAFVAYTVDVQTGVPRVWTGVGTALFVFGSFTLYDGLPIPWLGTVGGVVGMTVFMVYAMPAMTRTRFSTPTIDRAWLVGKSGESVDALGPEGVVRIAGGLWAGRAAAGATISKGAAVKVVAVDGVIVEVAVDVD